MGQAAIAPRSTGLDSGLIRRKRPELTRLAINDPRHPGLHGGKKAELTAYARDEMRMTGGIRVRNPEDDVALEPWETRNRWRWNGG